VSALLGALQLVRLRIVSRIDSQRELAAKYTAPQP
jgi:hypothetical protein